MTVGLLLMGGVLLFVIYVGLSGLRTVDAQEVGFKKTFGKADPEILFPGLHWILSIRGIQKLILADARYKTIDPPLIPVVIIGNIEVFLDIVLTICIVNPVITATQVENAFTTIVKQSKGVLTSAASQLTLQQIMDPNERLKLQTTYMAAIEALARSLGCKVILEFPPLQAILLPKEIVQANAELNAAESIAQANRVRARGEGDAIESIRNAAGKALAACSFPKEWLQSKAGTQTMLVIPPEIFTPRIGIK